MLGGYTFDISSVLGPKPLAWLASGLVNTIKITALASLLATAMGILVAGLRLSGKRIYAGLGATFVAIFRNTPLTVQLLFWYFGGFACLPESVRDWLNSGHQWEGMGVSLAFPSTELIAAAWGLGLFSAAFIAEELRAGVRAVEKGQHEAALSQGFNFWQGMRYVILPQGIRNAWQPLVGQYLNLMKLSSIAMAIGLAEISYQTRQIESDSFHGIEAFAAGTALYLALGLMMSWGFKLAGRFLFRLEVQGSAR